VWRPAARLVEKAGIMGVGDAAHVEAGARGEDAGAGRGGSAGALGRSLVWRQAGGAARREEGWKQ
jgi:hypothetical protein